MTDVPSLLPPRSSTALERSFEQASAPEPRLVDAIDAVTTVMQDRRPGWVPFLLWEYGLAPLTAFVPDTDQLLDEGQFWQLERGTLAGLARGLGWLDVAAVVEEEPTRRAWWNAFQLALAELPASDDPLLARIERIADLSSPLRSDFRRAFHAYDARALDADETQLDETMLDDESGVRLHSDGPLWSFGRSSEGIHSLTQSEGEALGIWIAPVSGSPLTWADITAAWEDVTVPWASSADVQRRVVMANDLAGQGAWAALRRADASVIGYRRARALSPVSPAPGGPYRVGDTEYAPILSGEDLYVEAHTEFGDGAGSTATSLSFIFGATLAAGVPPGALWLQAGDLVGGVEIAARAVSIPLRPTVRERLKLLVRF
jgi:hypothetical protein